MRLDIIQRDFSLDDGTVECFEKYAKTLLHWNNIHNLSGIHTLEEVYENIFDSIYPLKFIQDFECCIDIGSGSGFPAIPLAICKPQCEFVLIEPRFKRVSFLKNLIIELGLKYVKVEKCLIEDLQFAKQADLITSRGVMQSEDLIKNAKRFLKKQGHYLFYKGERLGLEINFLDSECFCREKRVYFYRKEN
ncbi:16S rRNA (guanine(527)-N(7))-methyltransferase RsmG [Helicobacter cappadocius]|uniref:Ribosomal RNA small subunit methyltransferase G n=1 Tax=Helicobacter cappadocius TaxID=3063998 RepID=A0AA90T5M0_9HELI|nr:MULTISPECIES: 16S rRNA (guanine(527)-N(7))-methyltransferase RsmG [unclassified Helicobacter]MDO7253660.1 16S rRNA (guanine(527)-N(7))-methyltransferase RsmG [Helicobacter sp. faydin-H75]MDP2539588.1 16S rRNA (guanine(527)-N(7))-methyltransferase RsmG [Helicobacter sp. faydin-H76]